jgi:hypothetical protein
VIDAIKNPLSTCKMRNLAEMAGGGTEVGRERGSGGAKSPSVSRMKDDFSLACTLNCDLKACILRNLEKMGERGGLSRTGAPAGSYRNRS